MKNYKKNARIKNIQLVFMFNHFKMGEQRKMCIWLNLNLNLEFELQYTSIKLNLPQTSTLYIMEQHIMCLCIYFRCCPPFVDDCFDNSFSETEITPEEEDRQTRVSSTRQENP